MNVQTLPPGYKTAPWTPPEKITAAMLADLKGVSGQELADATTENFFRLFSKARKTAAFA